MANPTPTHHPRARAVRRAVPASPASRGSTVRDEAVAARINAQLGARVVLAYEQHLGLPSCLGDTQHRVTGVRRVEP